LALFQVGADGARVGTAENCEVSLGFQAGQTLYLLIVLACHFFEIRNPVDDNRGDGVHRSQRKIVEQDLSAVSFQT
jgi:hypothetical protein